MSDRQAALQMLGERQVDCVILNPAMADLRPADFAALTSRPRA